MRCSSSYIVSRRAWLLLVTLSLIFTATAPLLAQESSDLTALSLEELLNAKVYSASKAHGPIYRRWTGIVWE